MYSLQDNVPNQPPAETGGGGRIGGGGGGSGTLLQDLEPFPLARIRYIDSSSRFGL